MCGLKGSNIHYLFSKYCPRLLPRVNSVFQKTSNINLGYKDDDEDDEIIKDLSEDLRGFTFLGDVNKKSDPDLRDVFRYSKKRGISKNKLWRYRLGACVEVRMRRRLIIPSFDSEGNLNYYAAREIDGTSRMKYINAPIPKKEIVFNEFMIDWDQPITLVEGPLDVISAGQNAVCLLGSHLAYDSRLFRKIVENETATYIALDADAHDKSEKISKMLTSFGIDVKEVRLPIDQDVSDLGESAFQDLRATATNWSKENSLLRMIASMKSGSLF